jgi:hypothetical protein
MSLQSDLDVFRLRLESVASLLFNDLIVSDPDLKRRKMKD